MKVFFATIIGFVLAVIAVIVGVFSAGLIFKKLYEKSQTDTPEPSVLAEWPKMGTEDGHTLKPVLCTYKVHEIKTQTEVDGVWSTSNRTGTSIFLLTWIVDDQNIGSHGIEVDTIEEAKDIMSFAD